MSNQAARVSGALPGYRQTLDSADVIVDGDGSVRPGPSDDFFLAEHCRDLFGDVVFNEDPSNHGDWTDLHWRSPEQSPNRPALPERLKSSGHHATLPFRRHGKWPNSHAVSSFERNNDGPYLKPFFVLVAASAKRTAERFLPKW